MVACYMNINSFKVNIKTEDVFEDISKDVEKRFGAWNYENESTLPIGNNKTDWANERSTRWKDHDRICRT